MYATVEDLRAEGVSESYADDDRCEALLDEASALIDRVTGWHFDSREATYVFSGRGTPSIEPPVHPIEVEEVLVDDEAIDIGEDDLAVVGSPVGPGSRVPSITRLGGAVFPVGLRNIAIAGTWGYLEPRGEESDGRTPLAIRRACILLVLTWLAPMAGADSAIERQRGRVVEERTRDQSYKLSAAVGATLTGDPDVDAILKRYRKPAGIGSA